MICLNKQCGELLQLKLSLIFQQKVKVLVEEEEDKSSAEGGEGAERRGDSEGDEEEGRGGGFSLGGRLPPAGL